MTSPADRSKCVARLSEDRRVANGIEGACAHEVHFSFEQSLYTVAQVEKGEHSDANLGIKIDEYVNIGVGPRSFSGDRSEQRETPNPRGAQVCARSAQCCEARFTIGRRRNVALIHQVFERFQILHGNERG